MAQRLRILSVIHQLYFGGDETRLLAFARTVDRRQFEHIVMCLQRPNADLDAKQGPIRNQFLEAGVDVRDLGEGHPHQHLAPTDPRRLLRAGPILARMVRKLCRIIRELRIDVIDGHLASGHLVGGLAGVLTHTPRTVTMYMSRQVGRAGPLNAYQHTERLSLALANVAITDSQVRAGDLRRWMARTPVVVIPNGVVPPSSKRTKPEMRSFFRLPEDPAIRVIGQIATIAPVKGQSVLIEAAPSILKACPNVAFLFVGYSRGDSTYVDQLPLRAAELGIADRVRIVGYPGPIADAWRAIDIHAHPSLFDSLPNAIMESMAQSLPAVVTSVGGIPEMVHHEVTGLVVSPGDPKALSQALLRLLKDEGLSRRLGTAAYLRYTQRYTAEIMTRQLEQLFCSLVTKSCVARGSR